MVTISAETLAGNCNVFRRDLHMNYDQYRVLFFFSKTRARKTNDLPHLEKPRGFPSVTGVLMSEKRVALSSLLRLSLSLLCFIEYLCFTYS